MKNQRKLVRLDVKDFLEIRPLNKVDETHRGETRNITTMGICFSAQVECQRGQVLLIDYFIPGEMDSVKLKVMVVWSEFIGSDQGYFCGGEIVDVEEGKGDLFSSYYYEQLDDSSK